MESVKISVVDGIHWVCAKSMFKSLFGEQGIIDSSDKDILWSLETAMTIALDEGGARGKAIYEALVTVAEIAPSKIVVKRRLDAVEARARRAAKRVGLLAVKSKCRNSKLLWNKHRFKVIDPLSGVVIAGNDYDVSCSQIIGMCNDPGFVQAVARCRHSDTRSRQY